MTLIAAWLRERRRRDLLVLSGSLVLGVIADAVLGGLVVYSKLNPWLVSLHMLLSLTMVVIAAVLYHHSKYIYGPGARSDVRDPHFRAVARALWIPFVILLVTGTMTTGSGPHAGSSKVKFTPNVFPSPSPQPRGCTRPRPCSSLVSWWACCSRSGDGCTQTPPARRTTSGSDCSCSGGHWCHPVPHTHTGGAR